MKIYLTNLERSPARGRFLQAQANLIGLQFERIPAVDDLALPAEMRSEFLGGAVCSMLTKGEIGCNASHLPGCVHINAGLIPCPLGLEDDGILPGDGRPRFARGTERLEAEI
jgi:GR25 family glycosyltransferase involved in LPS biosynthesis